MRYAQVLTTLSLYNFANIGTIRFNHGSPQNFGIQSGISIMRELLQQVENEPSPHPFSNHRAQTESDHDIYIYGYNNRMENRRVTVECEMYEEEERSPGEQQ